MQGLEQKKHETMLKVIHKFEELITSYSHIVPEVQNDIIREQIAQFIDLHEHYNILLKELEDCICTYKQLHDTLQRIMFPYVRKMNTKERNKRS